MMRRVIPTATAALYSGVSLRFGGGGHHDDHHGGHHHGDHHHHAPTSTPMPKPSPTPKAASPKAPEVLKGTVDYSGPVEGATGKDNIPGVYSKPQPKSYFEEEHENKKPADIYGKNEPKDRSDNLKYPRFDLNEGQYERPPPRVTGDPGTMRYNKYVPETPKEVVGFNDVILKPPQVGHHEGYDYMNRTGKREGHSGNMANTMANWETKLAIFSLYRCILRGLPLIKHAYWLLKPLDMMKDKVRKRFESNRYVRDPDAVLHLIHNGWVEYNDTIMFRRTRASLHKFFDDYEDRDVLREVYAQDEGKLLEERRFWNGEEQRREGPFDGHWSPHAKMHEEEFNKLAGRVPKGWTTSKGYHDPMQPDGTNYWEKNLDYQGWYMKNVDPDLPSARKEVQGWVEAGYNHPKHYASKNRRAHRRYVKDVESVMNSTVEENYARNREIYFQIALRDDFPESNRIAAEKLLAKRDDEVFGTKWGEIEKHVKQVMRELPNPRMWRTDAFYCRYRYLAADLEYNWAKVPIGVKQERLFNEWVSNDVNYAVYNSQAFADVKACKTRNPMSRTWADFYRDFDPDVEATRCLPWYHPDFDYERRHNWDIKCMREKKWLNNGDVDGVRSFFDSFIHKWEQEINRGVRIRDSNYLEKKLVAPRMVQLYRSLNRVMDVALANQIRDFVLDAKKDAAAFSKCRTDEERQALVNSVDFSTFAFKVPTIIYPDNFPQTPLGLDGAALQEA